MCSALSPNCTEGFRVNVHSQAGLFQLFLAKESTIKNTHRGVGLRGCRQIQLNLSHNVAKEPHTNSPTEIVGANPHRGVGSYEKYLCKALVPSMPSICKEAKRSLCKYLAKKTHTNQRALFVYLRGLERLMIDLAKEPCMNKRKSPTQIFGKKTPHKYSFVTNTHQSMGSKGWVSCARCSCCVCVCVCV